MPGYVYLVGNVNNSLLCAECKLVLKNAVQTREGDRLCKECFDTIAWEPNLTSSKTGVCVKDEDGNKPWFFQDKATRREVMKLEVFCEYSELGCDWKGALECYEEHKKMCQKVDPSSENVLQRIETFHRGLAREELQPRLNFYKPFKQVLRNLIELFDSKHSNDSIEVLDLVLNAMSLPLLSQEKCSSKPVLIDQYISLVHGRLCLAESTKLFLQLIEKYVITDWQSTIIKLRGMLEACERSDLDTKMAQRNSLDLRDDHTEYSAEAVEGDHLQSNSSVCSGGGNYSEISGFSDLCEDREHLNQLQNHSDNANARTSSPNERNSDISRIQESLAELVSKITSQSEELHVQRSLLERSNYINWETNVKKIGSHSTMRTILLERSTFNWKIPEIGRRTRDAIENRVTSLYSPPFYTGCQGYKMCMRAYLNGDGRGHDSHLSVFFVLMKGEYDNILEWPFKHKVTMILINQNDSPSIVDIFKPTSDSSSFQKPTFDMNIASGFPRFATQDLLGPSDGFVVGDAISISCIVDTPRVSQ